MASQTMTFLVRKPQSSRARARTLNVCIIFTGMGHRLHFGGPFFFKMKAIVHISRKEAHGALDAVTLRVEILISSFLSTRIQNADAGSSYTPSSSLTCSTSVTSCFGERRRRDVALVTRTAHGSALARSIKKSSGIGRCIRCNFSVECCIAACGMVTSACRISRPRPPCRCSTCCAAPAPRSCCCRRSGQWI